MLGDDPALQVRRENATEIQLANGTLFVALPGGAGGDTLRSYSAIGALIADEAAYCDDETFAACFPMASVSRGLIVLLSSANGRENLFGRLEASAILLGPISRSRHLNARGSILTLSLWRTLTREMAIQSRIFGRLQRWTGRFVFQPRSYRGSGTSFQ
jgi:hypothetical protein